MSSTFNHHLRFDVFPTLMNKIFDKSKGQNEAMKNRKQHSSGMTAILL